MKDDRPARHRWMPYSARSTCCGACDRQSKIGKRDKAIDEATARKWTAVDVKADWKVIFPPAK